MIIRINGIPCIEGSSVQCAHLPTYGEQWHMITQTASDMDAVMHQVSDVTWVTHVTYKAGVMLADGLNWWVHTAINEAVKNCGAGTGCF